MRCLVIGCGSIGTRRAKLLAEMGHEVRGVDEDPLRAARATNGHATILYEAMALRVPYDAAFVCTPPDTHVQLAIDCMRAGVRGVFVEKPLAMDGHRLDELCEVAEETGAVTMGACNLRFDYRLADLRGLPIHRATFTMGQHATYWSPTHQPVSMILDSIHELDLAVSLLGPVREISGTSDTERADVEVTHERGQSRIVLDRLRDPPVRNVVIHEAHRARAVNLWPPNAEMYRREMEHFLACVERGEPTCNPLHAAVNTLRAALEVA